MKITRNVRGSYKTFIGGEEIFIEHGLRGWYAGARNYNADEKLIDYLDYVGHCETKKELIAYLRSYENGL